jgi:hypothetical protein
MQHAMTRRKIFTPAWGILKKNWGPTMEILKK